MRTECIEERVLLDSVEKIRHVARFKKKLSKNQKRVNASDSSRIIGNIAVWYHYTQPWDNTTSVQTKLERIQNLDHTAFRRLYYKTEFPFLVSHPEVVIANKS
jgi:hypothetical protein